MTDECVVFDPPEEVTKWFEENADKIVRTNIISAKDLRAALERSKEKEKEEMSNVYLKLDDAVKTVMNLYKEHGDIPVFTDEDREKQMLYDEFYKVCDVPLMRGNEYQKLAARTCSIPYERKEDMLKHAVLGLNSEAGEVAGIFQKEYQGHEVKLEHLMKELGDCLWMIAEACTALDINMEDVMQLNIAKLRARFPEGFTAERSLHRAEGDI